MDFGDFFDYPGAEAPSDANDLVLLPRLPPEGWQKLLAQTGVQRFKEGETLIRAGDTQPALYIVVDGNLEVLAETEGGQPRRIAEIEAGSVFGEQAFFDGLPRSASVRALTKGEVRSLTRDAFEVLAAREPELARALIFDLGRILSLRLRRMSAVVARLVE